MGMMVLVLMLPLMMGQRTPETLTASGLVLVAGGLLVGVLALSPRGNGRSMPLPSAGWMWVAGAFTVLVLLQVAPSGVLARWFGPYPDALWQHPAFEPSHWSPNVHQTLRGWVAFMALFVIAWVAGAMPRAQRNWIWLAIVASACFQAIYGLINHAAQAESIFGIWERNNPGFVHGSFSNRNLFAAYLALTWPLAVTVWWMRDVPFLSRLPRELCVAGSLVCGTLIGMAIFGSASRMGAAAGVFSMVLALVLWTRHRGFLTGAAAWPAYLAVFGVLVGATWYGLTPLAERALYSGYESRLEVFGLMLNELPAQWYLHGVGLGGFEAVFKLIQPGHVAGWYDYAHNDLLQWLLEMGLPGAVLLGVVVYAVWRKRELRTEKIPLYAGLAALCLVSLGDFSWHIPATQVVLAVFLGVVLKAQGTRLKAKG